MNPELRQRLLDMVAEDERVRAELAVTGELFDGYAPRMEEVHRRNARELAGMIERHGWFGKSLVEDDGANAAWLILQHAIGEPELQRGTLPVLRVAVERGEAKPEHLAYLEDRISVFEQRPQRYGTQYDWDESGQLNPRALEDSERVDDYRRAVGLPPLAENTERMRQCAADEPRPADLQKRKQEMLAWAKSVGWL